MLYKTPLALQPLSALPPYILLSLLKPPHWPPCHCAHLKAPGLLVLPCETLLSPVILACTVSLYKVLAKIYLIDGVYPDHCLKLHGFSSSFFPPVIYLHSTLYIFLLAASTTLQVNDRSDFVCNFIYHT